MDRSVADGRGREVVGAWLVSWVRARTVANGACHPAELRRLDAPEALIVRADAAHVDAVRHARVLRTLATRHGVRPAPPSVFPTPVRELSAFGVENMVEVCVRETWVALVAHWQALHAADPDIAAAFARIAIDSARRAELGADLDRWVQGRVGVRERAVIRAARDRALAGLAQIREPDPDLQRIAGLPSAGTARRLLRGLSTERWDSGPRA